MPVKKKYAKQNTSEPVTASTSSPPPPLEVKKSFPGTLVDPLQVFLRKKGVPGKKDWLEQSVIRPTFTYNGKLSIANSALTAIAGHAAASVRG